VTITPILPDKQLIAPGSLTFNATVKGGATNDVTWTADAGTFVGNVWTSPDKIGTYTITATSVDNPSVSTATTVTVTLPVMTTTLPVSLTACTNAPATLTIAAEFADSYQWNLNGSPIPGATSSRYSIPSAASADAGNYTVTVSNRAGSVILPAGRLVVGSTITTQPESLSIYATQTATFSVSAGGHPPFTYQWYVIASGATTGTSISGATSSTYTTAPIAIGSNEAQYYVKVTDACETISSTVATLTVSSGNVPPTIITQPIGKTVKAGGTATFQAEASGTPAITYQWYRIPAGKTVGESIPDATSVSYTVPATATDTRNDQDAYYVIAINLYGQAVSDNAILAVGNGVMLQIVDQPKTVYINDGDTATFTVKATSNIDLMYQWYEAAPGSSAFNAIPGATDATYTHNFSTTAETGSVFYVVVSNGATASVQSSSAALFVGALSGIGDLCNSQWKPIANATRGTRTNGTCYYQLTDAIIDQHGEIVWPAVIPTGNIQLSFTATISQPSMSPADGFAMVLGDPSLGATYNSTGAGGEGLGAQGIPGFVLGFDTYRNNNDPPIPYLAVGRGETELWENPWHNVNTNIPALADPGEPGPSQAISHDYVVSIVQGRMTVTMDKKQVFSGSIAVPPVAYFYMTSSTGVRFERTVISNLKAIISAPSN